MNALRSAATRVRAGLRSAWSGSLVLRTVATTLALTLVVVGIVAVALLNRIASGLIDAKQQRSLTEATAGWEQALQILAAADAGPATASPDRIVDGVVSELVGNAGSPPRYEVLLLQAPDAATSGPERVSNLISPSSLPAPLAEAVATRGSQMWTSTTAVYLDGTRTPAMLVGAPVDVPGIGAYQLFHVFPYTEEERIITLVRSATVIAGLLLVVLLAVVIWWVTRQVAVPIRRAADVAGRIAEGDLDRRIPVTGSDEMARLGTSFNAMAAGLHEQIIELEDLSRMQQRFVSDVSHELRTPLSTVRMASDVLFDRRHLVDGDTRRAIELLASQVDRFELLLADLLEISRIDAGAAEVDLEEIDLVALMESLIASAALLAAERDIVIRLHGQSAMTVLADRRRVSRILRNLLTNALEYGAGRPIDILLASDATAAGLGVRDRGPGLTPDQQRRVFDRFWRADPSRARTLGGSGLGLAIAVEDAALQHGVVEVAASPGRGALFVLTLGQDATVPSSRPVPVGLAAFDAAVDLGRRS